MRDKIDALIEIIFDDQASITEKDDAVIYLGEFSEEKAVNALLLKSKDFLENEMILNSCGESIGQIWVNENFFDQKIYRSLDGIVRYGIYVVIKSQKPEWIVKYQIENDNFK